MTFNNPDAFRAPQTTEQVTQAAAGEFAKLAELLRRWKEEPHAVAHFLIRLLFCLFAEDTRLLPERLFTRLLQSTRTRPQAFAQQLRQLFAAMATGGWFGTDEIRYFNGRLFDDDTVLDLDSDGLTILARVSQLDWSSIEPSIFGTLFERSLDPGKRAQLGAHYTSREDILLIVEPVLMAPLRRRWAAVQQQAQELADRRDQASGEQRTRLDNQLRALLVDFAGELSQIRVLDPACGSGNFLYVALKQLLDLEKDVITTAGNLGVGTFFPSVSPEQLRGIEINEYAHELAQVTVWIGYIQWLRDNGFGTPSEPILKPLDTIMQMDAILAFDEQGQPVEPEWPETDIIIGNPPFLGGKRLRTELGDQYIDTLFELYNRRVPREADLVTYWFERARALIADRRVKRAGLLATNSIRQQQNRPVLDRIKQTGDIFMAWTDRPWILEGAAVRVSMVGFDDGSESERLLNGIPAQSINTLLSGALDLTSARRLPENQGIVFMGTTKVGAFELTADEAAKMLNSPSNPNGRPNTDVVRPWINGTDITGRPRGMWIIDFGANMPEHEAALYEAPYEYLRRHVKPEREKNKRITYRKLWWLHGEPRPTMREALKNCKRYIVTVIVAKHRLFAWAPSSVLADHRLFVFARQDDYFLGVLHSKLHQIWALRMGSTLEDRPSYSSVTCFDTFPFPWPPGQEPQDDPRVQAIAEATRALIEMRDRWLNPPGASEAELKRRTLTNLYNERPTWLDLAHQRLDRAVFDAYGWPHDLSDEEILSRLLALNLERASQLVT